jgi:hypothetical protein
MRIFFFLTMVTRLGRFRISESLYTAAVTNFTYICKLDFKQLFVIKQTHAQFYRCSVLLSVCLNINFHVDILSVSCTVPIKYKEHPKNVSNFMQAFVSIFQLSRIRRQSRRITSNILDTFQTITLIIFRYFYGNFN